METKECIRTRRSIRQFTDGPADPALIAEIIQDAAFAPSWKNTQSCRYTLVLDRALLDRLAREGVMGFPLNTRTIQGCAALVVLSYINGRAGFERDGSFTTSKGDRWQNFDAGIAAQTFCLAAWDRGLGSVILGIFDDAAVGEILGLPENETAAALIAVGYPTEIPTAPPRKTTQELLRIL